MSSTLDAVLCSWPFDPWLLSGILLCGFLYLRGWLALRRRDSGRWNAGHLAAFLGGLAALYLALASPIEPFAALLLQVHMVQHMLLMMVAPPLFWLGSPLFPLLRGLPPSVRASWVAPLLRSRPLRRMFEYLTHPILALCVYVAATWLWHLPAAYELAVRSTGWHYLQHLCFLVAASLFWYPVVRPYPSRPRWSLWLLLPCLVLADLANTVLSALLIFSNRPLYPYYTEVPRIGGFSVLDDQSAAGVIMWVPGSLAFLLPLFAICIGVIGRRETGDKDGGPETGDGSVITRMTGRVPLPVVSSGLLSPVSRLPTAVYFDLLRVPLLARFLKWRHARLAMQIPLLLLAALVILDGLHGPQVGPMNLAGVLPWIHWRGLLILGLLALGNVFCMACPFTVPRTLARRWLPQGRHWPRWLRNKWLAVALLLVFLWAYEGFALWDRPMWTAWIAIGYFSTAFVVDGFFRGAAFCKYVCPIGQFNFVQSLMSPLEVRTLNPNVCKDCLTLDCIRGGNGGPGCEMHLAQPRKGGNMDCTFCLDCVHACPHDNIGILARPPAKELWHDPFRSGLGRFSRRPDLAALVVILAFGAFANAAGMVAPVLDWRDQLTSWLWPGSPLAATSLFYVCTLLVLPMLMLGLATVLSRRLGYLQESWLEVATRYAYALAPIGFGMWLAHYSFHFLGSLEGIIPATQRFLMDFGLALGEPDWQFACCRPVADWLLRLELVFLGLGLLLSLYTGYRITLGQDRWGSQMMKVLSPWAVLIILLYAAGVWIVLQPMQMRGTFGAG
jgi:cytochrome c oxidase assembly factor CtaG/polyferredoxin